MSVAGGRRIEIKGVDNHKRLPLLVHVEAYRQLNLLRVRAELARRGVTVEMLALPEVGWPWEQSPAVIEAGGILRHCDFAPIREALDRDETVCAVRLPGFGGLLSRRTQPGVTLAREFADRVRVIACPVHRPFMIHSDIRDYGLNPHQWRQLRHQLGAEQGDAVVVVWAPAEDAATAAREICIRAQDAVRGVPAETRQAFRDGTNGFERILPGPDRMYPDTDTPPLPIADEVVQQTRARLPEAPWAREARYVALGLDPQAAHRLARAPWAELFDAVAPAAGSVARRFAGALERRLPFYRRRGRLDGLPELERVAPMVRAVERGAIRPEAMERMLNRVIEHPDDPVDPVLSVFQCRAGDAEELDRVVDEVVGRAGALAERPFATVRRWAMGQVMPQFVGRLAPLDVERRLLARLREGVPEAAT